MNDTVTAPKPTAPKAPAPKPRDAALNSLPETMLVLDTTATAQFTPRIHEMEHQGKVQPFEFHFGRPNELPRVLALRFLKHDAFKLVDKNGEVREFTRRPRQPQELQAGEKLLLNSDETIARYEELSDNALQHRCLEMPGSDQFNTPCPRREAMISFLVEHTPSMRDPIRSSNTVTDDDSEAMLDEDEAA